MNRKSTKIRLMFAASLLLALALTGFGCHSKAPEETTAPAPASGSSAATPDDPAAARAKATGDQNAAYQSEKNAADAQARKADMEKAGHK